MLLLGSFILATLVALVWVTSDTHAASAFEIFWRNHHTTARQMDKYWEWLFYSLWRCLLLFTLIALSIMTAWRMWAQNPFELGPLVRGFCLVSMLAGSLTMIAWPYLSAHLRFRGHLYSKAAELSELIAIVTSETEVSHELEHAEYNTSDGWTAWHPREEKWHANDYWTGVIPVVYLLKETASSVIVPVDWEHFLAWKLPTGCALPGLRLPVCGPGETAFLVNAVHELRGRPGWSVITTDMEFEVA